MPMKKFAKKRRSMRAENQLHVFLSGLGMLLLVGGGMAYGFNASRAAHFETYSKSVDNWLSSSSSYNDFATLEDITIKTDIITGTGETLTKVLDTSSYDIPPVKADFIDPPSYSQRALFTKANVPAFSSAGLTAAFEETVNKSMSITFTGGLSDKVKIFEGNVPLTRPLFFNIGQCQEKRKGEPCSAFVCQGRRPSTRVCSVQLRLKSICVTVSPTVLRRLKTGLSVPVIDLSTSSGCSSFPGPWTDKDSNASSISYGPFGFEVMTGTNNITLDATDFVTISVRSSEDPYVIALKETTGTNDLGMGNILRKAGLAGMIIGAISLALFIVLNIFCKDFGKNACRIKSFDRTNSTNTFNAGTDGNTVGAGSTNITATAPPSTDAGLNPIHMELQPPIQNHANV